MYYYVLCNLHKFVVVRIGNDVMNFVLRSAWSKPSIRSNNEFIGVAVYIRCPPAVRAVCDDVVSARRH